MSSYTMTLKEVMEMYTMGEAYSQRDRIETGRTKLFDFDYPLFDPTYKNVFETHFIRKFFMREIGFETEGLFKFNLESWLIINMPYFNKLFQSELIEFDPLMNVKVDTTKNNTKKRDQNDNRDTTQTASTSGTSDLNSSQTSEKTATTGQDTTGSITDDNFDRQLESNNPDSRLALTATDGEGVIEYASNIKENNENNKRTSTSNVSGTNESNESDTATAHTSGSTDSNGTQNDTFTSTINDTEDYLESKLGKIGDVSYSKLLQEYRETFMRIENRIFDEMQELFMLVY